MNTTNNTFREIPPNQTDSGSRKWLYPRLDMGRYFRGRVGLAVVLLVGLFAGPWVRIAGEPLFLFNVLERRFVFFGVPFWPQDFYLVAIGMLVFIIFIALFTVVYGRVWCGWACPQTIFMEMVFRPIENWIEGDHNAKKRLDAAPWTANKVWRKTLKHSLFVLVSFAIANTFLAYIIGTDALLAIITDSPAEHLVGLGAMVVFTGVFYAVFAYLREIVCIVICPYGRLQSALLDKQSIIVAYDDRRGEPRGKAPRPPKGEVNRDSPFGGRGAGDCIDCHICVQVCPTGIDIRNGLQMECINCTQCMDACDTVMDKIERPRGLIRYDSLEGIETGKSWHMTTRMWAYTAVLGLLVGVLVVLLTTRADLSLTLLRAPGQLFQRAADGQTTNLYTLEVLNKTSHPITVSLRPTYAGATIRYVQPLTRLAGGASATATFFIAIPPNKLSGSSLTIPIDLIENGKVVERLETRFFNE